ncbi:MAG: hypothetical protein IKQ48_04300 [Paludibacteraceae bacterium]|nr:hypothetical protein [Paludibacteraceae bacterium]
MKWKGWIALSVFSFHFSVSLAEVPVTAPDLSQPTGIAPAFFGPNAFPVPEMTDGRTYDHLRLEVAADGYFGYQNSRTASLFLRAHVPLFTRWANLSVWMPVYEWYSQSDGKGSGAGDAYVSTEVQVLHPDWFHTSKAKYIPQATVRAGFKSASGGQFERRRHFDAPGYFFDLSIGQSLYHRDWEFRLAGSMGFLCWQTDNGRQNDAVMYGVQALAKHKYVSVQASWGGYAGWERYGDRPMLLRTRIAGHVRGFEPFVQYQWGIKDYPFHQVRIGLAYRINILPPKQPRT